MAHSCPVESCAKSFSTAEKFPAHIQLHRSGIVQGHISDQMLTSLIITLCEHCAKPFLNLQTHSQKCPKAPTRGQVREVQGSVGLMLPRLTHLSLHPPVLGPSVSAPSPAATIVSILTVNFSQPQSQSPNALFSLSYYLLT
jgi:hypothetical protein